jgi:uncharacterized protein involved in exopolysaccharide biosynthesis
VTRHVVMRLIESYFRHRWLNLLPIVMMMAAGGLWLFLSKPLYNSHAVLYVQKESLLASLNAIGANNSYYATPAQVTSWEINQLVQTDAFIRAIIQQTDLEKQMGAGQTAVAKLITDVRKYVWSTPLGDNPVQINANYPDPTIATQLANGIIKGYIQWKLNASQAQSDAAQRFFNDLIKNYQAELDKAREAMKTYLVAHPLPVRGDRPELELLEIKRLQGDVDLAATRLSSVLEKEENARLAQVQSESDIEQTYVLIDAPERPLKPETSRSKLAIQLGIFVVVGLILSLTSIAMGGLLDHSIRFPYDVSNSLNLPVLAVVPQLTPSSKKSAKKFGIKKKSKSLGDENTVEGNRLVEKTLVPMQVEITPSAEADPEITVTLESK